MTAKELNRFMRHVKPERECWRWTSAITNGGYGYFHFRGQARLAHRISYEHHVGEIPGDMQIDHLCRVRDCVNPEHLEVVDQRTNLLRGNTITARNASRTHCPKGHPYTVENLVRRSNRKGRECRLCHNEQERERRGKGKKKRR